jgi:hypothetical protein
VIGGVLGNYRRLSVGIVIGVVLMGIALPMHAALTVLVGEPFGTYGTMMPVGHTAIYLDRVCADGPLHVRMCGAGERPRVVLARYHAIGPYDWLAVPVMEFFVCNGARRRCAAVCDTGGRVGTAGAIPATASSIDCAGRNTGSGVRRWTIHGRGESRGVVGVRRPPKMRPATTSRLSNESR